MLKALGAAELADILNCSVRTVSRHIKTLCQYGYLENKANFNDNGSQGASTYGVRTSVVSMARLEQSKDRSSAKSPTQSTPVTNAQNTEPELKGTSSHPCPTPPRHSCHTPLVTDGRPNNNIKINNKNNNRAVVVSFPDKREANKVSDAPPASMAEEEGFEKNLLDEGGDDEVAVQISRIEAQIPLLQENRDKAQKDLTTNKNSDEICHKLKNFHQHDSAYQRAFADIEKLKSQQQVKLHQSTNTTHNAVTTLSPLTLKRLQNSLKRLGFEGRARESLIHEIAFEASCGSLKTNNATGEPNSIERAINIALKLIREGRWQTPTQLNKHRA